MTEKPKQTDTHSERERERPDGYQWFFHSTHATMRTRTYCSTVELLLVVVEYVHSAHAQAGMSGDLITLFAFPK